MVCRLFLFLCHSASISFFFLFFFFFVDVVHVNHVKEGIYIYPMNMDFGLGSKVKLVKSWAWPFGLRFWQLGILDLDFWAWFTWVLLCFFFFKLVRCCFLFFFLIKTYKRHVTIIIPNNIIICTNKCIRYTNYNYHIVNLYNFRQVSCFIIFAIITSY